MRVDTKTGSTTATPADAKPETPKADQAPESGSVQPDQKALDAFNESDGTGTTDNLSLTKLPYLKLAHGVGEFAGKPGIQPGHLVLASEIVVAGPPALPGTPSTTAQVVVLSCRKFWKEYLDSAKYNAYKAENKFGASFATEEEALAAGFTTRFDPVTRALPTCPPAFDWTLLVKRPKGMESAEFYLKEDDESWWAVARMIIDKSSYSNIETNFVKGFKYAENVAKPYGSHQAVWELGTQYGTLSRKPGAQKQWMLNCRFLRVLPRESFERLFTQYLGPDKLAALASKQLAARQPAALPTGTTSTPAATP